jgi:hypothetical protein
MNRLRPSSYRSPGGFSPFTPPTKGEVQAMRAYMRRRTRFTFTPENQLIVAVFGTDEQRFWFTFYSLLRRAMDPEFNRYLTRQQRAYDRRHR